MLNLCKMEIYRGKKSKVVWITLAIMVLIGFGAAWFSTYWLIYETTINIWGKLASIMSSSPVLIFWAITMAVYVSGEYKKGFIKSIAGQIPKRGYLAISKMFFGFVYTIAMFLVCFCSTLISALAMAGSRVELEINGNILMIIFAEILVYWAFSMVIILITQLSRTSALGIGAGIVIGSGLSNLIYRGINMGLNKISILDEFDISDYMLETNLGHMLAGASTEHITRCVIIAIIFIVAMVVADTQVLEKRDI